jgi:CRP-like cAMP-binding protein
MSLSEFEQLFSTNKSVILKMLKVFSKQLRNIHKKTESILNSHEEINPLSGMQSVAQCFYEDNQNKACCDICLKFFTRYPNAPNTNTMKQLFLASKKRLEVQEATKQNTPSFNDEVVLPPPVPNGLKQFSLPAFSRFAKTFEPGSVIISEYEPGDCFYLIQTGRVQLVKCVNNKKKNLDILMPGEFFGEMAILENTPRSATCIAIDKVEVLEFNKQNFELLITGNPQIAMILIKLFCKRIYDQKRRIRTLVITDPQARIGDVFLMFDEMNPCPNPNERSRRFNLTIQDVAHWAGLPINQTRDELNKFVEKHKIEIYTNYIIVNNISDMKRFVDSRCQQR